jgi:endoglucanase
MEFLDTPAPSGFEEPAAELVHRYAASWADEVRTDAIGNVHVTVNKGAAGGRVMVTGHIDEIGFIVTRIGDQGVLHFDQIGGWDMNVPTGQRVRVLTSDGPILGTIGRLAAHQIKDRQKAASLKDLWIDVGAVDKKDAQSLVRVGDPIVLDTTPHEFANRRVMSRSADDRLGAFIALEVARRAAGSDVEVVALCATREEIGLVGAMPGTVGADPDEAVAIDVTFTSDVPGDHPETVEVGKGPVITVGAHTRVHVSRKLMELADDASIDYQLTAAGRSTGTDGDAVFKAGRGVPVSVVSVPTRYLHSPGELFALEDVEASIDLLTRWATAPR